MEKDPLPSVFFHFRFKFLAVTCRVAGGCCQPQAP
ncbi:hypothetical protein Dpo_3c02130 [Desulfotignum phosphitoxidans DSM 13687]|uniref:Uncharacterized protein n=1 Tax=Desulfotignum phosphitoxidans DSM 13687 TaxID=1286635 RepID=S0FZH9_9BACT|nr:hypothetical protein Dpo_3c02130 [Desulfotignum phosphitoxidans DSM 13687]